MKPNPSIKEQIREVLIDWIGNDYADLDSLMLKLTDIIDTATREARIDVAIELSNLYGSPRCEALHHSKKYQHGDLEDCPVEKKINDLLDQLQDQSNTKGDKS